MRHSGKKAVASQGEGGAAIVEFAILTPLLVLLVFGIIEFGYAMGQFNDVRHAAREAARLAAVDTDAVAGMGGMVCGAMDLATGAVIEFTDSATESVGEQATVRVTSATVSLTGLNLVSVFLPSTLESTVKIRLEQPSTQWDTGSHPC